jgi:hypothetical protein
MTDFAYSDIPPGIRADQTIMSLRGSIFLKLGIERPADTDQMDYNSPDWKVLSPILAEPAKGIYESLFGMASDQRDRFYQSNYAGGIASNWCDKLSLASLDGEYLEADFTLASRYGFGGVIRVDFTVNTEHYPSITRRVLQNLVVRAGKALPAGSYANVTRVTMTYTTDHFEHSVSDMGGTRDLIRTETGTIDPDGAKVSMPFTSWEKVNQRLELGVAASELVNHLNENIEYYHKAIWWSMDRRVLCAGNEQHQHRLGGRPRTHRHHRKFHRLPGFAGGVHRLGRHQDPGRPV